MKKFKKFCSFIFVIMIILFANKVKASSDFTLNNLDFDVKIEENGDLDITETWNISINSETNTLFKTFKIDPKKYDEITNVQVKDKTSNINFNKTSELMYHVTTNSYYALDNDKGEFEIAWGVNKSSGNIIYEISYQVKNVITKWKDCGELYWQLVGKDFQVPANKVTGTIILPREVINKENLRMWAHGPLNGEIYSPSNDTVKFEISPYLANTYIEIRLAIIDPEMFLLSNKTINQNNLENIISEETKWADRANQERTKFQRKEKIFKTAGIIISLIISTIYILKLIKINKKSKEIKKLKPNIECDYFREIPDEKETPGEAGLIYYYDYKSLSDIMPKILSATILELSLKGYIEFEIHEEKKKSEQVTIKLIDKDQSNLKSSEKLIYELFEKIGKSFSMKDFENYANKHSKDFINKLKEIEDEIKKEANNSKKFSFEKEEEKKKYSEKALINFVILFFLGGLFIPFRLAVNILFVIADICGFIYIFSCYRISNKISSLMQEGIDEKEKLKGLEKYMEDFSMLDEREIPELVLWEKFMVYATLFGISEKVLKQLKVRYPELENEEYLRQNMIYMHLLSNNSLDNSFAKTIDSSMQKAYNKSVANTSSSSGSGFGGGFSSGGGGRRRRRPEEVEDNFNAPFWGRLKKILSKNISEEKIKEILKDKKINKKII